MRDDRSVAFGGDCVMVPMDVATFDIHAVERAIEALGWSGEVRWPAHFSTAFGVLAVPISAGKGANRVCWCFRIAGPCIPAA